MKIIDAFWEQRNLGVKAFEIVITSENSFEDFVAVEKEILAKNAEYIVVKIPVNLSEYIWGLSNIGYTFIETAFFISLHKDKYIVPAFVARLDRSVDAKLVNKADAVEKVLVRIKDNVFNTDRISMDPYFTDEQGANRYLCWSRDMINNGAELYNVAIKDKDIGFFIVKRIDKKTAYAVLTGLYPEYRRTGLGVLLLKKCLDTIWDLGFIKIETSVASNNLDIIKIDQAFGFGIDNVDYVYVKHII